MYFYVPFQFRLLFLLWQIVNHSKYQMQIDKNVMLQEEEQEAAEETEDEEAATGPDFDYLLGMKMWSLTLERKNEILKNRDDKRQELKILKEKTPEMLWNTDMDNFLELVSPIKVRMLVNRSTPLDLISKSCK